MSTNEDILISKEATKLRIESIATNNDAACIIFGAGASFGYSEKHILKPPTVTRLFNKSNEVVKHVIAQEEHSIIKNNSEDYTRRIKSYGNDLERYLSSLYKNRKEDKLFAQLLTYLEDIFFIASRNVVEESNNYKSLINLMLELHGSKLWSCISFNYDTILEKSYLIVDRDPEGRNFSSLRGYTGSNPVILKMHGGINFRYLFYKEFMDSDEKNHSPYVLFSKMMSDKRASDEFLIIDTPDSQKPPRYRNLRVEN